jgi:histidinol-phosphate/aromatic aminotransferase/cobyric acid decarboxylase-like protein
VPSDPLVPPGAHGGEGPRLAARLGIDPSEVLDLSQSLNPVAPDLRSTLTRHLDSIGRYPDPVDATQALAKAIGIDAGRVVLTNGGAEAIALVAAHLGAGSVEDPEFSLYRRHLDRVDPAAPRWRSNPHNPSGLLADAGDRAAVWDEAFYPLATGTWTRGDVDDGSWVVGSLTKLFAAPGLRMGYALAPDPGAAGAIRDRQPEWAVGGLVCAALPELLDRVDLADWADRTRELRRLLVDLLERHGYRPRPSDANWVLVDSPSLRARLAPHAIAVRDCTSFGLPELARVAVPDQDGLARLDEALGHT